MTAGSHTDLSHACPSLQNCIRGLVALLLIMGLGACQSSDNGGRDDGAPPVVDVTALDYAFQAADSIPSGWTTFRMTNKGEETHHFHLYRLPEGKRLEDYRKEFLTPADSLRQLLTAGRIDRPEARAALDRTVSNWAHPENLDKRGGIGPVPPGRTGQITVEVDPGIYVIDCALRTPNSRVHSALGMVRTITVTEPSSNGSAPQADVTARISGEELIIEDSLTTGTLRIGFEVEDIAGKVDSAYYVWLVRLGPETDREHVKNWTGLNPPPTEFLGGFEYIEADRTAYMTVDLSPGRYAWHWNYFGQWPPGLLKEFNVE